MHPHTLVTSYVQVGKTQSRTQPLFSTIRLEPQAGVDLEVVLVAVLNVHTPEREAIHGLTKGIVLVIELDRALDIENDVGVCAHVKSVDGAWVFDDVVACLALP